MEQRTTSVMETRATARDRQQLYDTIDMGPPQFSDFERALNSARAQRLERQIAEEQRPVQDAVAEALRTLVFIAFGGWLAWKILTGLIGILTDL
jgi:hypothetical protein